MHYLDSEIHFKMYMFFIHLFNHDNLNKYKK